MTNPPVWSACVNGERSKNAGDERVVNTQRPVVAGLRKTR
jgi:hypothetical protein